MKNKYYFLISFILILLLFPQISLAWGISDILGGLASIPITFLSFVWSLILVLATALSWLFGGILDWVIDPNFVTINYTQPCPFVNGQLKLEGNCNPIIGIGLNITQSFVNLILIVFLIVIALAMALQYQEYGSRKTLAKLIIVALLVNFAPVLVGLIVDASNIFTYYFLSKVQNVASFGVATNRFWTDKNGEKKSQVEFHNVITFGRLAEIAQKFLKKGSLVYIEGRLQTRNWQDQQGVKHYRTDIIAERIQLGPKSLGRIETTAPQEEVVAEEAIPPEEEINPEEIPF